MSRRRWRASASVIRAGVQVGVDRQLLTGHRVQGEARGDFGDASGAVGDDDELDDDQDREDDDADGVVAADDDVTERLDDLGPRRRAARSSASR